MAEAPDLTKFLPPSVRRIQKRFAGTADRRKRKRITIEEINKFGGEQFISEHKEELTKVPDRRSAFTKFLDIIDVPRNVIANIVAGIAGIEPKKARRGAIMKKVWASDILEGMGMKKGPGRAIFGFFTDVALDPLTYLTYGALTGTRISKALPKILKPGMKAMQATAKAAVTGNIAGISPDVARGIGRTPQQLVRLGQAALRATGSRKLAVRRLMGRKGGLITRRLVKGAAGARGIQAGKAARQFVTKFGEKGRTIVRVPFMAKGLAVKRGLRAKLYKSMAAGVSPELATMIRAGELGGRFGRAAYASVQRAKAPTAAVELGKTRAQVLARRLRARPVAQAAVAEAKQKLKALFEAAGETPTPAQAKDIRKVRGIVRRGAIRGAQVTRFRRAQMSPEAMEAYRKFRAIERNVVAARKAGVPLGRPQIRANAAAKKKLLKILKTTEEGLKKTIEFEKGRTRRMGRGAMFMGEKVKQIGLAPGAPPEMRAAAKETFGKLRLPPTPAVRTLEQIRRQAGRTKQRLFGPGWSMMATREAGAKAAVRVRAPAAANIARREWTAKVEPIIAGIAQRTGMAADDVADRLIDVMEFSAKDAKFVPEDAVIRSANEIIGHLDEASKRVLKDYSELHTGALAEMKRRGVMPGTLEDIIPRRPTAEFAGISKPHVRRTLVDVGFDPKRVKEMRWTDPATGEVHSAFTTGSKEAKTRVEQLKEMAAKWGDKPETFDISTRRWNTDPNLAKSLLPPDFRGKLKQFKTGLPEAAAELTRQKVTRLALADVKDMAQGTGIRADLLSRHPERFPGFAQVRWEGKGATGIDFRKTPAYQTVFHQLEGQAYPQQIVDMIERFMTFSAQPEEVRGILRLSDKTINLWKGVTLLHPAYSIRNVTQNYLGNLMAGQRMGPYSAMARPGSAVHKVVRATIRGEEVTGFVPIAGRQVPAKQFADHIRRLNYIGSGRMAELPYWAESPSKFLQSAAGKPLRWWFGLNNEIESTMKAASLWGFLDSGMDLNTAAQQVARAMPDLADLTIFERNVARRLIPFYSWFRKNGSLQAFHYLPQKPAFIAAPGKMKIAWEKAMSGDDVVPEELRPAWMQNMQAVQASGDRERGTVFLSASWLPFQELVKLGTGIFDVGEGAKGVAEMARPSIRFGFEMAAGQDIFRRAPMPSFGPGEAIRRLPEAFIGRGPLGPILAARPVREAFRVAEMPSVPAGIARGVLGGALQPVSRERGLMAEYHRLREEAQELRSRANRALQVNDQALHDQLLRQYLNTLIQMQRMGLPGVPKATAAMFEQAGVPAGAPAFEGR